MCHVMLTAAFIERVKTEGSYSSIYNIIETVKDRCDDPLIRMISVEWKIVRSRAAQFKEENINEA